jgi:serine/threonine protein kinase
MKNFTNLHVMSLKGVCLDGGPVPYIVLPYMANGSLADYLKKERKNLVMKDDENEPQTQDLVSLQSIL